MTRSQLQRRVRKLSFELSHAVNRYAWSRDDWEQGALAEEARLTRDAYLDAVHALRWFSSPTPSVAQLQELER